MQTDHNLQYRRLKISLVVPILLLLTIWLMYIFNLFFNLHIEYLGIYPREIKGIPGILLSPFIHISLDHIISNSLALFILVWSVVYFYRDLGYSIIILSCIINNISIWFLAEEFWHIGASGLIYSLVSFLFISGLIRGHARLTSISFIVIFMYGSLFWGIFPTDRAISWESHLLGGITGMLLAIIFKNKGPQKPIRKWIEDNDIPEEIWNNEADVHPK